MLREQKNMIFFFNFKIVIKKLNILVDRLNWLCPSLFLFYFFQIFTLFLSFLFASLKQL
jgi:hypothetical protein